MASTCSRLISRTSASVFRSASRSTSRAASAPKFAGFTSSTKINSPPLSRCGLSRIPSELGCMQSLLPLHSAVALARMTSCLSTTSQTCRALSQELGQSVPR